MGTIYDRPVCEQGQHAATMLFLEISRPSSPCNRCPKMELAQRNAIGQSSMDTHPQDTIQNSCGPSHPLHYYSRMEDSTLVPIIDECTDRLPSVTTVSRTADPITNQTTQSSAKPKVADVRLSNIRTRLQAKKFLEEAIKKVQATTNKSSNITVGSAFNKRCVWCNERNMDHIQDPIEHVIEFLNDMCNQHKAFNTIASYRSAISEAYSYVDGYPEYFSKIINPKETNISITHGGNKHRTKKIFIDYYEDRDLCPASTILKLLDRTHDWRDTPEKLEYLFLTSTTSYRPASSDTIARWLKLILMQADPTAKAKDVRVLSALLAQDAGADMNTLLALGNWTNYAVYQRFYQRGIRRMLERNKVSSQIKSYTIK
ncbi:19103_t:CDS:2, partial [Cetraspora pellucida]